MTFEKLRQLGLKKVFLKNADEIECEKWEFLGRFILPGKNNEDACCVDMRIYYYDDKNCYVNIDCSKSLYNKRLSLTIEELVEYQYFFTHIFDIDDYVKE